MAGFSHENKTLKNVPDHHLKDFLLILYLLSSPESEEHIFLYIFRSKTLGSLGFEGLYNIHL